MAKALCISFAMGSCVLSLSACAAPMEGPEGADGDPLLEAEATIVNSRGTDFRRMDLWGAGALERINQNSRKVLDGSQVIEHVADGLRGQMIGPGGRIYLEVEPNLALAESVLADADGRSTGVRTEGGATAPRRVFGADGRSTSALAATAFQEAGGSGTRVGADTMVTAAHVLYETFASAPGPEGWKCQTGDPDPDGCTAYPRWRFGVNGLSGHSNWVSLEGGNSGCTATIPNVYKDVTDNTPVATRATYDYAVVDLSGCPSSYFPNAPEWVSTDVLTDLELNGILGRHLGYPKRVPCPSGSRGLPGDCPNGVVQWTGNAPQYTGAKLYYSQSYNFSAGSAYTILNDVDSTVGQSGGMLYHISGGTRYLIGWASQDDTSQNIDRRWTQSMYDWVEANSTFPNDT